jgi:lipopolysaccharide transport system ATP-binding protein
MSDTMIFAERLGKRYQIGRRESYYTLRDKLSGLFASRPREKTDKNEAHVWALRDVSFEVQRGDVLGIIGTNGAGKSTLLKIISRITEPTSGEVRIRGRVGSLLEIGTGFHPELTGRENIFLNGAILGMKRTEILKKFDEIVSFAEVEKFIDTPVKHYSSGMYVRLAFAVAAHLEHEILLIDEILAVGDMRFQKKCLGKMGEVGESGRTILFVSHNMATINLLCSKAILMDHGGVVCGGKTKDCIDRYVDICGERSGRILRHLQPKDPSLRVTGVRVNGFEEDIAEVISTEKPLRVEFGFEVLCECRASIYACLKDDQGQALAIYSPGHMHGSIYPLKPGFRGNIIGEIQLPSLNKGSYFLDLALADPGFKYYAYFPFGLEMKVQGSTTKTGQVFEQGANDAGYQVLPGNSILEEKGE